MRIESLPKWAQRRIANLERDLDYWQERATEGPKDADTFLVNMIGKKDTPLGNGELIAFKFGPHPFRDVLRVRLLHDPHHPRAIEISGDGQIHTMPRASNLIWVTVDER